MTLILLDIQLIRINSRTQAKTSWAIEQRMRKTWAFSRQFWATRLNARRIRE